MSHIASHLDRLPSLRRNYYRRMRTALALALGVHVAAFLVAPPYRPAPRVMRADPLRVVSAQAGWAAAAGTVRGGSANGSNTAAPAHESVLAGILQADDRSRDIQSEQWTSPTKAEPQTTGAADAAGTGSGSGYGDLDPPPTYYDYDVAPRAVRTFEPDYPSMAKAGGVEGTVVINVNLDERGRILRAWVASASASEILITTALEAVYRFEFAPGRLRGAAVRSTVAVPFRFHLNKSS